MYMQDQVSAEYDNDTDETEESVNGLVSSQRNRVQAAFHKGI